MLWGALLCDLIEITSSDTLPKSVKTANAKFQSEMMLRCLQHNFDDSDEHKDRLWQYLCTNKPHNNDPCAWRGVTCTDGTITHFLCVSTHHSRNPGTKPWIIDTDWLPSTLLYVHLSSLRVINGWLTKRFPRALRYFHTNCLLPFGSQTTREVDLHYLPSKMEELHITGGWCTGRLWIAHLPPSMRLCLIQNYFVKRVTVDNESLPQNLELLMIRGSFGKAKVRSIDGKALDDRVKTIYFDPKKRSEAFRKYKEACRAIYTEFNVPRARGAMR